MADETERVSYSEPGYQTIEGEAEARQEERERLRRRLLCCIRGQLRERAGLRWWLAVLLIGCAALAWCLAGLPALAPRRLIWGPALAVLATWPPYVLALYLRARIEGPRLELAGHWDALIARDERGEYLDREVSEKVEYTLNKGWESTRYSGQEGGAFFELIVLTVVTIGTWAIWDLLRMGPGLMAEIILDGVVIPTCPQIAERMPSPEPWYKTAFASTGLHFFGAAVCTLVLVIIWKYAHMGH